MIPLFSAGVAFDMGDGGRAGQTVAVLGGGMAAAQLALGALSRGAQHVTLISRR